MNYGKTDSEPLPPNKQISVCGRMQFPALPIAVNRHRLDITINPTNN